MTNDNSAAAHTTTHYRRNAMTDTPPEEPTEPVEEPTPKKPPKGDDPDKRPYDESHKR